MAQGRQNGLKKERFGIFQADNNPAKWEVNQTPTPHQCTILAVAMALHYGNRDCQASKGFDKHVQDDDAGFVDT